MTVIAPRKRRGNPEANIQRQIVRFLLPILPRGAILHHSANEIRGGDEAAKKSQAIAKGMGVFAGFSDLVLFADGRVLFLEVKTRTGSQSDSQIEFQALVEAQGHPYEIVRSCDDALAAIDRHRFPTKIKRRVPA